MKKGKWKVFYDKVQISEKLFTNFLLPLNSFEFVKKFLFKDSQDSRNSQTIENVFTETFYLFLPLNSI